MSGLVLSMEGKGNDIYLFWTSECNNTDHNVDKTNNNGKSHTHLVSCHEKVSLYRSVEE